jgi:hypothetical protein
VSERRVLFMGLKPTRRRFRPITMESRVESPLGPEYWSFRPRGKPRGGLYTCPEDPHLPGYTPWQDHEMGRRSRGHRATIWRLRAPDPRLLLIASGDDALRALERYPWNFLTEKPELVDREPGGDGLGNELDHAAIAADGYDGIEIEWAAMRASWYRHPFDPRSFDCEMMLSGYDVETVLWYRWAFRGAPERVGRVEWRGDDDDEEDDEDDESRTG